MFKIVLAFLQVNFPKILSYIAKPISDQDFLKSLTPFKIAHMYWSIDIDRDGCNGESDRECEKVQMYIFESL